MCTRFLSKNAGSVKKAERPSPHAKLAAKFKTLFLKSGSGRSFWSMIRKTVQPRRNGRNIMLVILCDVNSAARERANINLAFLSPSRIFFEDQKIKGKKAKP